MVARVDVAGEIAACVRRESPGMAVRYITTGGDPGSEGSLQEAVEFVGEAPVLLHRGDGMFAKPLRSIINSAGETPYDALLLAHGQQRDGGRLRLVDEDSYTLDGDGVPSGMAGACLLGPGMLARLPNPERGAQLMDLAAIAEQVAFDGGDMRVLLVRRWKQFAGDPLDLLDLNRTVLDRLRCEAIPDPGDDNRFEGYVSIHPTARVTSSVIIGPVMIGADARISDSYIGPHTSIAERVLIEGTELERSIVLADASVLHVGGRLVASIVGCGARIFRDFSMPRALRLQVGDGDEVALC